jgi:hypothetical protein
MVNKNLDLVDSLSFADTHIQYEGKHRASIYDEIFQEAGFNQPDLILLTGAPSKEEEQQRRELAIDYMKEVSDQEKIPRLLTTPSHREELIEDDRLDESDYIFHSMDPDSSHDEIEDASKLLDKQDKIAVVTSDYHVPRYEKRMNSAFSSEWSDTRESWGATLTEFLTDPEYGEPTNDYIVLGAEFDENENNYSSKWVSEAIRTALPQKAKDFGKNYVLQNFSG